MHARTDGQGRPLCFVLTSGEASDYLAFEPLMALDGARPHYLLADKRYDGDGLRQSLLMRGILPVIPPKSNRHEPVECDYRRYWDRNRIERMFGRIKQFRRIAARYDKTALSFLGFLHLAATRLWLPTFGNRA